MPGVGFQSRIPMIVEHVPGSFVSNDENDMEDIITHIMAFIHESGLSELWDDFMVIVVPTARTVEIAWLKEGLESMAVESNIVDQWMFVTVKDRKKVLLYSTSFVPHPNVPRMVSISCQ